MWKYTNVTFIYDNRVDSVFGQKGHFDEIFTYMKSKYALMQALNMQAEFSFLGPYVEIDPRTVKHDKPIKV